MCEEDICVPIVKNGVTYINLTYIVSVSPGWSYSKDSINDRPDIMIISMQDGLKTACSLKEWDKILKRFPKLVVFDMEEG